MITALHSWCGEYLLKIGVMHKLFMTVFVKENDRQGEKKNIQASLERKNYMDRVYDEKVAAGECANVKFIFKFAIQW